MLSSSTSVSHSIPPLLPRFFPDSLHPSISTFLSFSSFFLIFILQLLLLSSSASSFLSPHLILLSLLSPQSSLAHRAPCFLTRYWSYFVFPSCHVKHQRVPGEPVRRGDHPSGQDPLLRWHQHGDSKSDGSEQRRWDQEWGVELCTPTAICGEGSWRRRGRGGEESWLLLPLQEEEVMSWRRDYDQLCFIYFLAF